MMYMQVIVRHVLAVCVCVILIASPFVVRPYRVQGQSMHPTLRDGQIVFVWQAPRFLQTPSRGDIVVLRNPHKPQREIDIKRIVGLPGETIHVHDDKVVIGRVCDGTSPHFVPEMLEDGPCQSTFAADTVLGGGATKRNQLEADMFLGPLDYYVLGDNRQGSLDSRLFGAVQPENLIGRVLWKL